MLRILCSTTSLFLDRYVVITKSGDPELQLVLQSNILRLKYIKNSVYRETDNNVLKILKYRNGYRFKYKKKSLYNPNEHELTGGDFGKNRRFFLFQIKEQINGIKIVQEGLCFEKMGWNEQTDGFYVGLLPCRNVDTQVFTIRPVVLSKKTKLKDSEENKKLKINFYIDDGENRRKLIKRLKYVYRR